MSKISLRKIIIDKKSSRVGCYKEIVEFIGTIQDGSIAVLVSKKELLKLRGKLNSIMNMKKKYGMNLKEREMN